MAARRVAAAGEAAAGQVAAAGRVARLVNLAASGPAGRVASARPTRLLGRLITIAVILLWSLFPIYWALNTSLTTLGAADSTPSRYFPSPLVATNYRQIFGISGSSFGIATQLGRSLLNSAIESGAAMVLTVVIAVLAAYAFARLEFRFKRTIFVSVLATLLLPAYATLIPLYRIMASLSLVNTYIAVILVYVSGFLPLAIWILYNYFNSIPRELEEAAFVDGASPMRALIRVVVPVAMPGIAAAAIISFLLGWAQFLFPLVLTTDLSTQPVTVIVAALNEQRIVPFTLLMACGVLAAAVPGVLALILNRYIVEGITAGSVK
jgi:multiple sugar transport system permease protein